MTRPPPRSAADSTAEAAHTRIYAGSFKRFFGGSVADDDDPIYRSSLRDHRNEAFRNGVGPPGFTSLILDAVKRPESDGNVAPTVTDTQTQGLGTVLGTLRMKSSLHFGLAFAVGVVGFNSTAATWAAALLVAGSAMHAVLVILNWLTKTGDQFAQRSPGSRSTP